MNDEEIERQKEEFYGFSNHVQPADKNLTDITWGDDGATFNHLGGRYSSYDDLQLNNDLPKKDYHCPHCRSEQIQTFQLAYRSGTSQNTFYGSGYSVEAGNVNISGTSYNQSHLAGITSPPSRPKPFLLAIVATFVIPFFSTLPLLITYLTSPIKFRLIIFINVALIAAAYVLCAFFAPSQWKKYQQKYADWEHAWICLRCGHSFYL